MIRPQFLWENLLDQVKIEFGHAVYHRIGPEQQSLPRILPDEQLHLIHAGHLHYTIGKAIYAAHPQQVAFCPPGIPWWWTRRVPTQVVRLTVIHFQARFPGGQRYLDGFNYPAILTTDRRIWKSLCQIGQKLCRYYKEKPSGHALKEQALIYDFFHAFFELRGPSKPVDRDGERVSKLIRYMQQHYREHITQELLGKQVFVSANHLATIFRRYTGQSPIDYLIRLRIEEARQLLQTCEHTIAEVAALVGYDDPAYFSRLFRKCVSMAPSDYRQKRCSLT